MTNDYERVLLGQILSRPGIIDEFAITESLFAIADYRAIFAAIERARNEFSAADLVAVGDVLQRSGRGDLVAMMAGLEKTSPANAGFYADQLREVMRRKSLYAALKSGAAALKDESRSSAEVSDEIMAAITGATRGIPEPEAPTMANIMVPYMSEVEARIERRRSGTQIFADFGLLPLDSIVSEILPGEVIVIAGRPGAGKTALALQMVRHTAQVWRLPCAFFSMEMRRSEVLDRLVAESGSFSVSKIRGGYLSDFDRSPFHDAARALSEDPITVFDGAHSLSLLRSRMRREKAVRNLSVACIDYIGLVDPPKGNGKVPRWEWMGEVTRTLKLLALELDITIVEVVQLNREADGIEPTLGALRDSGAIEQDADRVVMLHRNEEEKKAAGQEPPREHQVKAIIAKNRHGPLGFANLLFDGPHVNFRAMEAVA